MGVGAILDEWTAWRTECVKRRVHFDLGRKKDKLHLLLGLRKILLDIDRAISIIRDTESDAEVVPNLMIGFGIDELQAEFIAEIRLRNINKEHILKRISETDALEGEIRRLEDILQSRSKVLEIIVSELESIIKRYPTQRRTAIVYETELEEAEESEEIPDYPVHLFFTREGYAKKITPQSLRMSGEHKLKEGDAIAQTFEASNRAVAFVLTNRCQAYKFRLNELSDSKASVLGDFLPQTLGMDEGEAPVYLVLPGDYKGSMVYVFENGKVAKVELSVYETRSNRKRLTGALSDKSPLVAAFHMPEDDELALFSGNRLLVFNTAVLAPKSTRSTQGVNVMSLKRNGKVERVLRLAEAGLQEPARYRTRTLPAAGATLKSDDLPEKQLSLLEE